MTNPLLRALLTAMRKQGNYAAEDGTEIMPVFKASGSKLVGWLTPGEVAAAGGGVLTTGVQTIAGQKTFSSMPIIPVNPDLAATGTNLATAAQLLTGFTVVTGADGTVGVKLPATPAAGSMVIIKGTTAAVLKVWPDAAATINAIGSNGAMSLASGVIPAIFIAKSATQWYTIPLLPS